jgi:hypothetical protein
MKPLPDLVTHLGLFFGHANANQCIAQLIARQTDDVCQAVGENAGLRRRDVLGDGRLRHAENRLDTVRGLSWPKTSLRSTQRGGAPKESEDHLNL